MKDLTRSPDICIYCAHSKASTELEDDKWVDVLDMVLIRERSMRVEEAEISELCISSETRDVDKHPLATTLGEVHAAVR